MASQPRLSIPLEVTRMICRHTTAGSIHDVTHVQSLQHNFKILQNLRLVSSTFAVAGAESLFEQIQSTLKYTDPNAQQAACQTLREITEHWHISSHVRDIVLRLDLRRDKAARSISPQAQDVFAGCFDEILNIIPKYTNVEKLVLVVDGQLDTDVPGHQAFILKSTRELGKIGKQMAHLRELTFTGHRSWSAWIAMAIGSSLNEKLATVKLSFESMEDAASPTDLDPWPAKIWFPTGILQVQELSINGLTSCRSRNFPYTAPRLKFPKATVFSQTPALRKLHLEWTDVKSEKLYQFLKHQGKLLEHVDLQLRHSTHESYTEAPRIYSLLLSSPRLISLSIRWQRFHLGDFNLNDSLDAPLQELCLDVVGIPAELLQRIIEKNSATLQHVHLVDMGLKTPCWSKIFKSLMSCSSLTQVCLSNVHHHTGVSEVGRKVRREFWQKHSRNPALSYVDASIRAAWELSYLTIDPSDSEEYLFRLGELLRVVIARGGNKCACECKPYQDRVYGQYDLASLHPWADVEKGVATRDDVFQWDQKSDNLVTEGSGHVDSQ